MIKILKVLLLSFFLASCSSDNNLYIIIENKTNYNISNILITDTLQTEYIKKEILNSGESYKVKINNSMDNSIKIKYTINGKSIKRIAIGYIYNKMQGTKYFIIK